MRFCFHHVADTAPVESGATGGFSAGGVRMSIVGPVESAGGAGGIFRPGVKCGYADVVTGNLRMLLRINIRKLPCLTSAKCSCLINDAKCPFISLNVTVLATKNLGTNL